MWGLRQIAEWFRGAARCSPRTSKRTRRFARFELLEQRLALTGSPLVDLDLQLTDRHGEPLAALAPGQDFLLTITAQDLRDSAHGVFAAYLDITWDSNLAETAGPVRYGSSYPSGHSGSVKVPGLIDEGGAFSNISELGGFVYEVFSVPMRALAAGSLSFATDLADVVPSHNVLLYGSGESPGSSSPPVPFEAIRYGTASIVIGGLGALPDALNVAANSGPTSLDVLANDRIDATTGGTLTIQSVSAGDRGGTVSISPGSGRLTYKPASGFVGDERFSYTIADGRGRTSVGQVTVHVEVSGNNPPIANGDRPTVVGSTDHVIDVLRNDSTGADAGETLTIVSVGVPSQGGTATIVGRQIVYRPVYAYYLGETFTYTIADGRGGTAIATVDVHILPPSANDPRAQFDAYLKRPDGQPLESLTVGQDFVLHVYGLDARADWQGLFAAYLDVLFDGSKAVVNGPIEYFGPYQHGTSGNISTIGLIGEAGATSSSVSEVRKFNEIFRVPMRATGEGSLTFTLDAADELPMHDVLLYGLDLPVPISAIHYGSTSITVGSQQASNDHLIVAGDVPSTPLDVLANDFPNQSHDRGRTIVDVEQPSAGGTVEIAGGGKFLRYHPAEAFNGVVTFGYTSRNAVGELSSAMVTLNVVPAVERPDGIQLEDRVLFITGSPDSDQLTINARRGNLQITGTLAGERIQRSIRIRDVQRVEVELGEGDDTVIVGRSVRQRLFVDGGAGDDSISAGGASAILLGGEGDDRLTGGARRDLLIGGEGVDLVLGNVWSDLVIGGSTAYDDNAAALTAILAEWNTPQPRTKRLANLRNGAGTHLSPQNISIDPAGDGAEAENVDQLLSRGWWAWFT